MKVSFVKLFFCFLFFNLVNSYGQENKRMIKGKLIDSLSNQALPFANLYIEEKTKLHHFYSMSDLSGSFNIYNLTFKEYNLIISHMGYYQKELSFKFDSSQVELDFGNIKLITESKNLPELTIRADKPFIQQSPGKITLNVSGSFMANIGNAKDVLNRAPSVQINDNGNYILKQKNATILIDGKSLKSKGEDLDNILSTYSSQNIEKIELISSPGSKYEASSAAVINIITLASKNLGSNGNFNIGIGQGYKTRLNSGLTYNLKKKKLAFILNYNNNFLPQINKNPNERIFKSNGEVNNIFEDFEKENRFRKVHFTKTNFEYFVNKKSKLGFIFQADYTDRKRNVDANTKIGLNPLTPDSTINSFNNSYQDFRNINANLNYKYNFNKKGKELSFDFDLGNFSSNGLDNISNRLYKNKPLNSDVSEVFLNISSIQNVNIKSFKIDYSEPFKLGMFTTGIQLRKATSWYDFELQNKINSIFEIDKIRSFNYFYNENINSAYVSFNGNKHKIDYQIGTRVEQTIFDGKDNNNQTISRNYFQFFPNISLQKALNKSVSLTSSYSKNIIRPEFIHLSNVLWYQNLYYFKQGNSSLIPEISNNLEFGILYNNVWNFNLNISNRQNFSTYRPKQDGQITIYQIENFKYLNIYSFDISFSDKLNDWWSTTINFQNGVFDNKISNLSKEKNSRFNGYYSIQNVFNLSKKSKFDFFYYYITKQAIGPYTLQSIKNLDLGFQRIINKKSEIRLSINDVFNSYKLIYKIQSPDFEGLWGTKPETRFIKLTYSYRFGNSNVKLKDKKLGTEKELNRFSK